MTERHGARGTVSPVYASGDLQVEWCDHGVHGVKVRVAIGCEYECLATDDALIMARAIIDTVSLHQTANDAPQHQKHNTGDNDAE